MKYLLTGQESKRLLYRNLEETDFEWWLEFTSDKEATRYFDFTENLNPEEFCRFWFDKVFERYRENTGGHNVLVDKITGERIGMCGLLVQEVDGILEMEIGYSIHPKFWRMGYATEASNECREFAFKRDFADSLISIVHKENIASMEVAKNNKMEFEKDAVFKGAPVFIFRVFKDN
ncbi:GNAT family N-acetyltransferase [Maribellus maritimus]|uniref:GNAT family N-acetyltransferase n=1 Tax=Maribellus maritimus TaxID=2870838 RepID=UPI001EEA5756|nr:GNAT family N-acetyltransferase [Maribellus maritimus]MCG6189033.1 GNAT family N-acetyltransferase [Maribellus maritimus]